MNTAGNEALESIRAQLEEEYHSAARSVRLATSCQQAQRAHDEMMDVLRTARKVLGFEAADAIRNSEPITPGMVKSLDPKEWQHTAEKRNKE